jgi:allantoinase
MSDTDVIIRSRRVVTPFLAGPASIHVRNGVIDRVGEYEEQSYGTPVVDFDNSVVMPGLVDSHVHVNQPGRTEWEGFQTATRAAAAGGVTSIVDMPLNSIPATTTCDNLRAKLEAARGKCFTDVAFWAGVVPGNASELTNLGDFGVVGFKCFLVDSGVDEFANVSEVDLREAMPILASIGALLIVHAEVPGPIEHACNSVKHEGSDSRRYETFLMSRPPEAEDAAVQLMVRLCREFGTRVHIVHHSSASSLSIIRAAKAEGLPLTAETCPHYLYFASEEIPDGATEFKCCPPIRERANRERLWEAVMDGTIEMIVSDHSPCPPEMKERERGDFMRAWGGISSLQLRLPIVWTMARERNVSLGRLSEWLCSAPARLVGLGNKKGRISAGYDADLVIWRPEESFVVEGKNLYHRHKVTPYIGQTLKGVVQATYLRGYKVFEDGNFLGDARGNLILAATR